MPDGLLLQFPFIHFLESRLQGNLAQSKKKLPQTHLPSTAAAKSYPCCAASGVCAAWREASSGTWVGKKTNAVREALSGVSLSWDSSLQVQRNLKISQEKSKKQSSPEFMAPCVKTDLPHCSFIASHFPTLRDHNWQLGFVIGTRRHILGTNKYRTLKLIKAQQTQAVMVLEDWLRDISVTWGTGNSRHSSEEQKSTITHLATGPTISWWILSVSRGLGHRPEAGPLNWREGTEQKLESFSWDTWGCSGFDTKSSYHEQNKLVLIQKGKRQWQSSSHSDPPDVLDSAVPWISNFLYFGPTAWIPKADSPQPPSRLYHAVQLLPCDLFSKPNSSVFAPLSRLEALMHIIPCVSWSQCWLSQRTCCYLLNLLIILPWHPGLTLAAITTRTVFIFSSWKPIRRLV